MEQGSSKKNNIIVLCVVIAVIAVALVAYFVISGQKDNGQPAVSATMELNTVNIYGAWYKKAGDSTYELRFKDNKELSYKQTAADGTVTLTTECFENIVLMLPFTALFLWTVAEKIFCGRKITFGRCVWISTKTAFLFSLAIEFLQLFLRLGTFQLSDLFYNTLGGALGGMIYWICWKIRGKNKKQENKKNQNNRSNGIRTELRILFLYIKMYR